MPIKLMIGIAIIACVALAPASGRGADEGRPFPVEVWEPPFNQQRQHVRREFAPLARAAKPWQLCASIPHLKDDYWLAVNAAMIAEARRLGVRLNLFEAGGYENLDTQKRQIAECTRTAAQGLILGAISADGLNDVIAALAKRGIPVLDLINGVTSTEVSARAAADFYDMGFAAGQSVRKLADAGAKPLRVAWFPGPEGAGWVKAGDQGFRDALRGARATIVDTRYGDTGIAAQTKLLNTVLDREKDVDCIAGTAVTAEAAAQVLRERKRAAATKIVSYYFGSGVYRGIQRGTILAAPTDQPALQARIAINLMVRILEKADYPKHVSAPVVLVDSGNVGQFDVSSSLAPPGFRPIFSTTE
jgi:protein TorT